MPPEVRVAKAAELATQAGWQSHRIMTGRFTLQAMYPPPTASSVLTIYLEGDGLAWLDRNTPSPDPTPLIPVGLQLALTERSGSVVYLGRPCQYIKDAQCTPIDWTSGRFSLEIVSAVNQAIDQLKIVFQAERLQLIGYSGGGTLAALLAVRRNDVAHLVTVASVLDTAAWSRHQGISPLSKSLNPADEWESLARIPQQHFIGTLDTVTGIDAMSTPVGRKNGNIKIRLVDGFDHQCCWVAVWPSLRASWALVEQGE